MLVADRAGAISVRAWPATLGKPVRSLARTLRDRVDRRSGGRAFVRLEAIHDPEALVTGVTTFVPLAVEVDVPAVGDVATASTSPVLGAYPRVIPNLYEGGHSPALDSEKGRVFFKLRELA
jgi:hypothetical protein